MHVIGGPSTTVDALEGVAAHRSDTGTAIVGEGCLDQATGDDVRRRLAAGEVVIVLAQPESAAEHYPVPVDIRAVDTEWGSSVFHFTTDHGALQSLPRRNVLVAEDSTIQAHGVVTRVGATSVPRHTRGHRLQADAGRHDGNGRRQPPSGSRPPGVLPVPAVPRRSQG